MVNGVCQFERAVAPVTARARSVRILGRGASRHPKPGAPDFETAEQLYIDPAVCIDCDACVEACPVDAIFPDFETPEKYDYALDLNAEFFVGMGTAERTAA